MVQAARLSESDSIRDARPRLKLNEFAGKSGGIVSIETRGGSNSEDCRSCVLRLVRGCVCICKVAAWWAD